MSTRREWIRQAAGAAATAVMPALLTGRVKAAETARNVAGTASLKAHAAARSLLTGGAINANLFRQDTAFRTLIAEQYNIVVPENCLKWNQLRPTAETWSFADADPLVAFAQEHGIKVRGHNFVWHEALPNWFAATVTKDNARQFLTNHINTVAARYKGRIHSWDVVNEAIWIQDGRPDGLRSSSPWFQMLGPEYLDLAFRTARRADPKALLTYNEYGIEYDTEDETRKRVATLALLRRMKAAGTPIDALGIQSHIDAGGSEVFGKGLRELLAGARALNLQVFITELDVKDDAVPNDDIAQRDRIVAAVYRNYLKTVLESPTVKAVLTWGVTDGNTWLNNGTKFRPAHPTRLQRPLPFDADLRPVPAFFAIRDSFDAAKPR